MKTKMFMSVILTTFLCASAVTAYVAMTYALAQTFALLTVPYWGYLDLM
jgi:hypothetical protein